MIIDAHCHIHTLRWVKPKKTDDFLIKEFNITSLENEVLDNMREANIDKTIIFPMPSIEINLEAANIYCLYLSKLYSNNFIPFAIIDEKPEKWIEFGIKGFKEHTFGQRIQKDKYGNNIFSQKFKQTYKLIAEKEIPLLLHAGENRVDRIKNDMLKDVPNLKIILAHLGADFPERNNYNPEKSQVEKTLKSLKHIPNIMFDIAAIRDIDLLKMAIDIVGIEKLIFGSDFPYEKPINTIKRINRLNLSDTELEQLCYLNIASFIGEK